MKNATMAAMWLLVGCTTPAIEEPEASSCGADGIALPDGSCIAPGMRPEDCGAGFVHDGARGCRAVVPPEPCGRGTMALPGEEACRVVAACPSDAYGDAPVDATTQYVDGAYVGNDGNGSRDRPWRTLTAAVSAAASGAVVAIAAGRYEEAVLVEGKSVRLWGRCPELVEVVSPSGSFASIELAPEATASEVHRVSLSGAGQLGLIVSSPQTIVDSVWIHDVAGDGLVVQSPGARASATIRNVLVEAVSRRGMMALDADATIERVAIRDVALVNGGAGLVAQTNPDQARSQVYVSDAIIERTGGAWSVGSELRLERVLVRDVQWDGSQNNTAGIVATGAAGFMTTVVVDQSEIARAAGFGLVAEAADVTVSRTVIHDVYSATELSGQGIFVRDMSGVSSTLTVSSSVVARTFDTAVHVQAGSIVIEDSVVRDVSPGEGEFRGFGIQVAQASEAFPTTFQMRRTLIERAHDSGVAIGAPSASIESCVIRETFGAPTAIADGIVARTFEGIVPAVSVSNTLVHDNGRAGIATLGAQMTLEGVHSRCNGPDLNGESFMDIAHVLTFDDTTRCGCPEATDACEAVSLGVFE